MNILVFGASTTYGAWDVEGGWVGRLRRSLDQRVIDSGYQDYFVVYNLGISGDDSEGLLERFEFEAKRRIDPDEENLIIFCVGINDSLYVHETKSSKLAVERYKENVAKMIDLARAMVAKVVFVGSMPVDESRVDPIPWLPGHSYLNKYVEEFNLAAEQVCQQKNVQFVDVYGSFKEHGYVSLLADGVHPNGEGHQQVYELVKQRLLSLV